MSLKSKNKVSGMDKKSKMELRPAKITVENENKVCGIYKKEQSSDQIRTNDS